MCGGFTIISGTSLGSEGRGGSSLLRGEGRGDLTVVSSGSPHRSKSEGKLLFSRCRGCHSLLRYSLVIVLLGGIGSVPPEVFSPSL